MKARTIFDRMMEDSLARHTSAGECTPCIYSSPHLINDLQATTLVVDMVSHPTPGLTLGRSHSDGTLRCTTSPDTRPTLRLQEPIRRLVLNTATLVHHRPLNLTVILQPISIREPIHRNRTVRQSRRHLMADLARCHRVSRTRLVLLPSSSSLMASLSRQAWIPHSRHRHSSLFSSSLLSMHKHPCNSSLPCNSSHPYNNSRPSNSSRLRLPFKMLLLLLLSHRLKLSINSSRLLSRPPAHRSCMIPI